VGERFKQTEFVPLAVILTAAGFEKGAKHVLPFETRIMRETWIF
jgi:hypothetical protein